MVSAPLYPTDTILREAGGQCGVVSEYVDPNPQYLTLSAQPQPMRLLFIVGGSPTIIPFCPSLLIDQQEIKGSYERIIFLYKAVRPLRCDLINIVIVYSLQFYNRR